MAILARLKNLLGTRLLQLDLRGKIAVALLVAALLMGAAVTLSAYFVARHELSQHTQALLDSRAHLERREIELRLTGIFSLADSLAVNTVTANALADSRGRETYLDPLLRNQKLNLPGAELTVVDYRGRPAAGTREIPTDYGRDASFMAMMALGQAAARIVAGPDGEDRALHVALPIHYRLSGNIEGGVILRVPLHPLLGQGEWADSRWLTDATGSVLVGKPLGQGAFVLASPLSLPSPIDALGLTLIMARDHAEVFRALDILLGIFLLIGIFVVAGVIVFAHVGARFIARPLGEIAAAAEMIAASGRPVAGLPVRRADEFGRLSAAFNTMVERLHESYVELENRVDERTRDYEASQQAMRQRELYLRATLDNLPFFFWLKDAESRFLAVNKVFADACGRGSPDAVVGLTDFEVWPHELAERYRADDFAVMSTRQEKSVEEPVAGGSAAGWIETYKKPVIADDGTLLGTVGFARDISERRMAEAAIRDRNAQLDAIFALSPDGFVSFDREQRVKYASPAFLRMTGLAEADVVGLDEQAFSERLARECIDSARFIGVAVLRAGQKVGGGGTAAGSGRNGERHLIELSGAGKRVLDVGLRLSDAETVSQILYFRDITHETEVDRMKSEFLSTAAHELRTPMASIYGFSELMLTYPFTDEERKEYLQAIHNQSQLMVSIINELLDLARIEARRGKDFNFAAVEVCTLLHDMIGNLRPPEGREAPQVSVCPISCWIRADGKKLVQAVGNVLSNAYKYSPQGGAVEVSVLERAALDGQPRRIGIRVRDHGIGMTAEQQGRVCERFYRADSSGKIPGTGLGMSIVKEIIELHGGALEIDSKFGVGTTITLWLPAAPGAV